MVAVIILLEPPEVTAVKLFLLPSIFKLIPAELPVWRISIKLEPDVPLPALFELMVAEPELPVT